MLHSRQIPASIPLYSSRAAPTCQCASAICRTLFSMSFSTCSMPLVLSSSIPCHTRQSKPAQSLLAERLTLHQIVLSTCSSRGAMLSKLRRLAVNFYFYWSFILANYASWIPLSLSPISLKKLSISLNLRVFSF